MDIWFDQGLCASRGKHQVLKVLIRHTDSSVFNLTIGEIH